MSADDKQVLDDFTKKSLLLKVENSRNRRAEVVLKDICGKDETTFGAEGSKLRRNIQTFWGNVKRQTIRSYVHRLKKEGIVIGSGTRQELLEQGTAPSPPTPADSFEEDTANDTAETEENTAEQDTKEEAVTEAGHKDEEIEIFTPLAKALQEFHDLSLSSRGRVAYSSPPTTSSARRTLNFEGMASSDASSDEKSFKGSKANPHIINVDTRWPERHHGFDIEFIDRIEHLDHILQGYHIRRNVSVADAANFEATMFTTDGLKDRAVLIKGPSRSSWYSDVDVYHRRADHCENTKEKHASTVEAIQKDEGRWFQYWLLIFSKDVVLENSVLSAGDPMNVKVGKIGVRKDIDGNTCLSSFVNWRIAVRGGGFRKTWIPEESVSDMFA
jgi:hypothetical protein